MNYVEPIRDKTTVQDIADYLREKDPKYYIMYMIGIYSVNAELSKAIEAYCQDKKDYEYLVPSARVRNKAVSREYAYRVIHEAGVNFGLDNLGTHTMRKTFGYHFYLQTKDIVLLMRILNHHDQSKTLRYIGIEQSTINDAMKKFSYK